MVLVARVLRNGISFVAEAGLFADDIFFTNFYWIQKRVSEIQNHAVKNS